MIQRKETYQYNALFEEYHPFGTTSYRSGRSETETSLKRYKYVGKERDEETGLYYYGARFYDAQLGRWHAVDPMAEKYFEDSPYNYVGNNPIKRTDPTGKEWDTKKDEDKAKEIQNNISKKNIALTKKRDNKTTKYNKAVEDGKDKKAKKLAGKIADLNGRIETNENTINTITQVGDKKGIKFKFGSKTTTATGADGKSYTSANIERDAKGVYVINTTGTLSNQAHELTHAGQVADGVFKLKSGTDNVYLYSQPGATHPLIETPAYKAQYGIDGSLPFKVNGINDNIFYKRVEAFLQNNPHY